MHKCVAIRVLGDVKKSEVRLAALLCHLKLRFIRVYGILEV